MEKRKILLLFLVLIVAFLIYLLAWPVPISPSAWTPPRAPELTGFDVQNSELSKIERWPVNGFAPRRPGHRRSGPNLLPDAKMVTAFDSRPTAPVRTGDIPIPGLYTSQRDSARDSASYLKYAKGISSLKS